MATESKALFSSNSDEWNTPEVCGGCEYCVKDKDGEWVCSNTESDYYLDYVGYDDYCDEFNPRGIEL